MLGLGDEKRVVNAGTSVVVMIRNGLGFMNRRLYLTAQFENNPVGCLLGKGLKASELTGHTLGQTLDEVSGSGSIQLFGQVAYAIAVEQGLLGEHNHLDTTCLSSHGQYDQEVDERGSN